MQNYEHILVALDESSMSYAAAEHARELAKAFSSKVTLVSIIAVDPFKGVDFYKVAPAVTDYFMQAEQHALDLLNEIKANFVHDDTQVTTKIIHGMTPSEGILQAAQEVPTDLIIMGSHGRKGLQKLMLGSVAQNVLSQSEIPVLIVRS